MEGDARHRLTYGQVVSFLEQLTSISFVYKDMQANKQLLTVFDHNEVQILRLRLPLMLPLQEEMEPFDEFVGRLPRTIPPYVMLLVQAGKAALGYFEEGEVVEHKVFQRYAVRRKHGKSQVKHLKKKSSKSAGGQLRMQQTQALFEDINGRLQEWHVQSTDDPILYYCPTNLWQFFFSAKISPVFDRKDERLRKIPRDISVPTHKELLNTNKQIRAGWLEIINRNWEERIQEWLRNCQE